MEIYNLSNPSFMKLMRKEDWKIIKDAFKGVLKPVNNFVYMNFFFVGKVFLMSERRRFSFQLKNGLVCVYIVYRHKK